MWECLPLAASLREEAIHILKNAKEIPLFLLSNLVHYGLTLTEHPNSGNVYCICQQGKIDALFTLTRRGNLLAYARTNQPQVLELIAQTCLKEPMKMQGLIGEWEFCQALWRVCQSLQVVGPSLNSRKEVVYTDLQSSFADPSPEQDQYQVALLQKKDYPAWRLLRSAYREESQLPADLSEAEEQADFFSMVDNKIIWGYFLDGQLVSIANLNAYVADLGQLGGVFTHPHFRKRGYARAVIKQILKDMVVVHQMHRLKIFTEEDNWSARHLYESFGIAPESYFAVIFTKHEE